MRVELHDGEWVATLHTYPSLSWVADTPIAALDGLLDLVAEVEDDLGRSRCMIYADER